MAASQLRTIAQAAELLNVSTDQIYALVKARKLSHARVSIGTKKGAIRFTEQHLENFIARNSVTVPADKEHPDVSRVPQRKRLSLAGVEGADRYA